MSNEEQVKPKVTVIGKVKAHEECGTLTLAIEGKALDEEFFGAIVSVSDSAVHFYPAEGSAKSGWFEAKDFLTLADALREHLEGPAARGTVVERSVYNENGDCEFERDIEVEIPSNWPDDTPVEIRKLTQ